MWVVEVEWEWEVGEQIKMGPLGRVQSRVSRSRGISPGVRISQAPYSLFGRMCDATLGLYLAGVTPALLRSAAF